MKVTVKGREDEISENRNRKTGGKKKSKLCRDCEPGLNSFPLFQEVTVFRQKKMKSLDFR